MGERARLAAAAAAVCCSRQTRGAAPRHPPLPLLLSLPPTLALLPGARGGARLLAPPGQLPLARVQGRLSGLGLDRLRCGRLGVNSQ